MGKSALLGAPSPGERLPSRRRAGPVHRWWMLWLSVAAGSLAAHFLHPDGLVGHGSYLMMTMGAAVTAIVGARRQPASQRFPWGCIALGVSLSAIGDAIYYVMGLFSGTLAEVSVADGFWLASYVALAVGLSSVIVGGHGQRRADIDGLIDIGSFAILAAVVVTQLTVVHELMNDSSYAWFTRVIWTAYPLLDAALLGVVVQSLFSRKLWGRSGIILTCGVALWLISDFTALLVPEAAFGSRWLDAGWMLGAASLAVSAWPPSEPSQAKEFTVVRVTDARLVMTLLPLLVPALIDIWEFSHGRDPNPVPLVAAMFALVALAFARSTRLVKARNNQEAALERSTRYYAALAENSSDAVIVIDTDGRVLNEAPNLVGMLGRAGQTTIGMDAIGLLRPFDPDGAKRVLARWWSTTGVVDDAEMQATQADGSDRWFGARATNLSNDPDIAGLVINLRDITDRKHAEQELSHSALHDSLTGLANRALFRDRLEHSLERTAHNGLAVAIVYLDLDGFKVVNDSRGHEVGDQVLREVANRLINTVRTADTVSRLGGDEFAILTIESPNALDEAETIAERVLQSLTAPFDLGLQQIVLSASIGIAVGDIACTASSMLRDADVAMYKAKTTGKSKWALYEPAMRTAALELLELETDLHQALDNHQMRLVFQPIIELETSKLVGFEALLRWDHPTRGVIAPADFIPVAENNGTIVEIGRWVLDEACHTAAQWQSAHPEAGLTMAVNLSARQIATPDIVDHVAKALDRSGFKPASLVLEMTESVLVQDADTASERLGQLRALGVRLAIDDFGTGYSSLSYLRQFPVDILKIDKSFIETITDRSQIPAIVRGLLDLAKTLRMTTVAEGIEFDVQLQSLRDQHCEFGQGFLFAKPLDRNAASELITHSPMIDSARRASDPGATPVGAQPVRR